MTKPSRAAVLFFVAVFLTLLIALAVLNTREVRNLGFFVSGSNNTDVIATQSFVIERLEKGWAERGPRQSLARGVLWAWTTYAVALVLGDSFSTYLVANIFFIFLLVLMVGLITARVASWWAGPVAMMLTALTPTVYGHALTFTLDPSVAAMVVVSIYCLLHADGYRRWPMSLLAGLFFGLALLAKPTAPLYLVPAFLAAFLLPAHDGQTQAWWRRVVRFAAALAVAAVVFFPLQARYEILNVLLQGYSSHLQDPTFATGQTYEGFSRHAEIPLAFGMLLMVVTLPAMLPAFWRRDKRTIGFLVVAMAAPVALFSFRLPFDPDRFFLAPIGLAAALTAVGLVRESRRGRALIAGLALTGAAVLFFVIGLGVGGSAPEWLPLTEMPSRKAVQPMAAIQEAIRRACSEKARPLVFYLPGIGAGVPIEAHMIEFAVRLAQPNAKVTALGSSTPVERFGAMAEFARHADVIVRHVSGKATATLVSPHGQSDTSLGEKSTLLNAAFDGVRDQLELVASVPVRTFVERSGTALIQGSGVMEIYRSLRAPGEDVGALSVEQGGPGFTGAPPVALP